MGTSVGRPPAVAHGGHSSRSQLREGGSNGARRRGSRQQSQRCAGGSPSKKLNDVVAEKHQRCTVGWHLGCTVGKSSTMYCRFAHRKGPGLQSRGKGAGGCV